jgi:glucose/arabinose dehydrogenase
MVGRYFPSVIRAFFSVLLIVGILFSVTSTANAALPPGFFDTLETDVGYPTALAFTPGGHMLITTQPGQLRVYQNGALLPEPALDLSNRICSNSERGLLGVAIDPAFVQNHYIYLYYTFNRSGSCATGVFTSDSPVNRVSRFVLGDDNTVNPASEAILLDNIPSPHGNHNGGDLQFGKDNYLYISVGDGGCDYRNDSGCAGFNDAARDTNVLLGKILRITRDGGIPSDNPFQGTNSTRCNVNGFTDPGKYCQETFAMGLRNPFRMALDPNASGTRFFINDVGQNAWEEIDQGKTGADYGWNLREGPCPNGQITDCSPSPAGLTDPIYAYPHASGCSSITGGAFVPAGIWPSKYDNAYFYSDYVCGTIFSLQAQADGSFTAEEFATGLGRRSAVSMTFDPHEGGQALYYTTYANGGQVRRISFTGADNRSPEAVITANPTYGPVPLTVVFDGSKSTDPDRDVLNYEWSFGDGSPPVSGIVVTHTYETEGTYYATLTVDDLRGGVDQATVRIDPGHIPPAATILSPAISKRFRVGEVLTLDGRAIDENGNQLPPSALSWSVLLHHNDHDHPYLLPTTGTPISLEAPAPEDLAATETSYLIIQLTATDARGLSSTVSRRINPKLVDLTFATQPSGLQILLNGERFTAPVTVTSWQAYRITINAPDQTDTSGRQWTFESWSDGGAQSHVIETPPTAKTYTATFQ